MSRVIATLEPLIQPRRIARMKTVLARRSDHVAFVFEQMVDPHNLSAALRSLEAFAFQDAWLVNLQARIAFARKVTQGSERWLTLHETDSMIACAQALRREGYCVLASHLGQAASVPLPEIDFRRRVALVFGNEHEGVSEQTLALADGCFRVEMLGFVESLNLSVAAALCAYQARRELERLGREEGDPARFLLSAARREEIYEGWLRRSVRRSEEILAEQDQRKGS